VYHLVMNVSKVKYLWFTLIEVVLVASIFSIIVSWIVLAINRSYVFLDNTRLSVRSTNLAREWVEMMFTIRDTNWREHSGDRDKYWLDVWDGSGLFKEWIYVLREEEVNCKVVWEDGDWNPKKDCNIRVYAKSLNENPWKIDSSNQEKFYSSDGFWEDEYSTARDKAKLTFSWTYSYYDESGGVKTWTIQDALVGEWLEFYRIVRVYGVYKKNVTGPNTPVVIWSSVKENEDWTPAEMRFCVKVFYRSTGKHSSELCGIVTNFME